MGRALSIDLDVYLASREDALIVLHTAILEGGARGDPDYSALFRTTDTYCGAPTVKEKTINLLRALGALLEDLLLVVAGAPGLIRVSISQLNSSYGRGAFCDWIDGASRALVQAEQGMRRNLLRSLSLDAMTVGMAYRE